MVLILILLVVHTYNINQTFWCPNIEHNDVMEICKKEYLTEEDYLEIFMFSYYFNGLYGKSTNTISKYKKW